MTSTTSPAVLRWSDIRRDWRAHVTDWRNVTAGSVVVNREKHGYDFQQLGIIPPSLLDTVDGRGIPKGHFIGRVVRANRCRTDDELLSHHGNPGPKFVAGHEFGVEVIDTGEGSTLRVGQLGAGRVRSLCGCKFCGCGQTHFCQGPFDASNGASVERGIAVKAHDPMLGFGGFRELVCYPDSALSLDVDGLCRAQDLALGEPASIGINCLMLAHTEGAQIPYWAQTDDLGRDPVVVVLGLGPCAAVTGIEALCWEDLFTFDFRAAQAERLSGLWDDVEAELGNIGVDRAALDRIQNRWESTLLRLDPVTRVRGTAGWFPQQPFSRPGQFKVVFISKSSFDTSNPDKWDPRWRSLKEIGGDRFHYVSVDDLAVNDTGYDFTKLVNTHPAFAGRSPCMVIDFCTSARFATNAFRSRHLGGFGGADTVCVGTSIAGPETVEAGDCGTQYKWDVLRSGRKVFAVNFPYVALDYAVRMLGQVNSRRRGFWDNFVQQSFSTPQAFAEGAIEAHAQPGVFRIALDPNG
ncbi:MAG: alcohol dehydrogenase catalytic domain-containing protein [Bdellovibrionota bacterium]